MENVQIQLRSEFYYKSDSTVHNKYLSKDGNNKICLNRHILGIVHAIQKGHITQ